MREKNISQKEAQNKMPNKIESQTGHSLKRAKIQIKITESNKIKFVKKQKKLYKIGE